MDRNQIFAQGTCRLRSQHTFCLELLVVVCKAVKNVDTPTVTNLRTSISSPRGSHSLYPRAFWISQFPLGELSNEFRRQPRFVSSRCLPFSSWFRLHSLYRPWFIRYGHPYHNTKSALLFVLTRLLCPPLGTETYLLCLLFGVCSTQDIWNWPFPPSWQTALPEQRSGCTLPLICMQIQVRKPEVD